MRRSVVWLAALWLAALTPRVEAQVVEVQSFTNLNQTIPDGNASGVSDVRTVSSAVVNLSSVRVRLWLAGEFNGDLYGYVRHIQGGTTNFCVLLNRVGRTLANPAGYADAGLAVLFDDSATQGDIHTYHAVTNPPAGTSLTGTWQPDGRWVDPDVVLDTSPRTTTLGSFNGTDANGEWTLYLADVASGGTNLLVGWELDFSGRSIPSVSWPMPADITYGTTLSGTQLNASSLVGGTFTYNPPAGTALNAGSNQTLSVTFSPTDPSSYLPITTNVSLNVLKKALSITANSTNKAYGAALPALSATFSGFVNGDTTNSLTAQPVLSTTTTASSAAGNYSISAGGASSTNYSISYVAGTLTVTPASLTITANSTNKLYGAPLPLLGASFSGFVNGDTTNSLTAQPALSTTASASSTVGAYSITATGASGSNYTIGYAAGTLTVTAVPLTITANNTNKLYGAPLPVFSASFIGFVNADMTNNLTAQPVLSTTATASSSVGAYAITAGGASSSNYTIAYVSGTLTVLAAGTTGLVSSSANPASPGQPVSFTLALSAVAPGAGTPTGTALFRFDGTNTGGPVSLGAGTAIYTNSGLAHGYHTLVVEYAGDGNFKGTTNLLSPNELINTPPVPGAVTIYRDPTNGTKVSIATLLGNAFDADGDTVSFLGVGPASANGGAVVVNGAWVFYTPPAGYTNTDTFTYTISDGLGAPVTGVVTVAVGTTNGVSTNLIITALGGTSYLIRGNGIPNRTYHLQYTDTPNPANWQTLGAATADQYGFFELTDFSGSAQRFYRSVYP